MPKSKVVFEKTFFLGLFAFVRKLELSLHRSQSYSQMQEYNKSMEEDLEAVLEKLAKFSKSNIRNEGIIPQKFYLIDRFFNKYSLYHGEILTLYNLLEKYKINIQRQSGFPENWIFEVKQGLRHFYDHNMLNRMKFSEKEMLLQVSHLNQNDYLKTYSIEEMIGKWY